MNVRLSALVMLAVQTIAVTTHARPKPRPPVSAEAKKQANEHYERGLNAYNFGNYDVAIQEYLAAFELTGAPAFLFNIAQTYRTKGDKQRALEHYKKYIELDPSGEGVASARDHIAAIEKELREEAEAAEQRRRAEADAERKRQEQAEAARVAAAEAARREATEAAQRRVRDAELAQQRKTARYFRISGIATGGAGALTLGVATYFGVRARSLSRDASNTTIMWTENAQRTVDRAESSEQAMFILLGTGGALAITGAILFVIGSRKDSEATPAESKRVTFAPAAISDGAGVLCLGRF